MLTLLSSLGSRLKQVSIWTWLACAVTLLGLLLRVEHALTFDHVNRGSDYNVHWEAVEWVRVNWRPFFHTTEISYQIRSYPPLWYFLSAAIMDVTDAPRAVSALAIVGWALRHLVLALILWQAIPGRQLARLAALGMHAVLPLGVLIDGKVNPEGWHSGVFAVALYGLWRFERQCQSPEGASIGAGLLFGGAAGVALLSKITGGMLLPLGALVIAWHGLRWLRLAGLRASWRRVAVPALAGAVMWALVAGWWSGINLAKFGHPFPHVWALDAPETNPILLEPAPYRRPLGWALPFEWRQYWEFPILRTPTDPRPNFWATEIAGTWSDIYNRGFCRLEDTEKTHYVWGGRKGWLSQHSDAWAVTTRCANWLASMVHVGVWLTAASVLALAWCLYQTLRSWGARGSLALSLAPVVGTYSALWMALAYPYDHSATLNPRYLLSSVMPLCACLAFGLAQLEILGTRRTGLGLLAKLSSLVVPVLIAVIGAMLLHERFGH